MKTLKILVFITGLIPVLASAAFPAGQYTATFISESSPFGIATQGICIEDGGTWYSTTFSSWSGKWFLKGNDLHLHGNYDSGLGNDAFELTKVLPNNFSGYWQEWRDDGTYDNYLTVQFRKTGAVCALPVSASVSGGNPAQ